MQNQKIVYPYDSDIFGQIDIVVTYDVRTINRHGEEDVLVDILHTDWGLEDVAPMLTDMGTELITDYIMENL